MLKRLMEKSGKIEVFIRRIATILKPVKRLLKRKLRKVNQKASNQENSIELVNSFRQKLGECNIKKGDIVLIHSSMDGLESLNLTASEIVDLILDVFKDSTVVFAAFPIEPKLKKEVYKYSPKNSICWTGMLPNVFLQKKGVKRSLYPYNSLACVGPQAEQMLANNLDSETPHGENSAWDYCYKNHAKILFLGTTSREANTMAIHMVPDVLKEKWPVDNWYENRKYIIKNENSMIEKKVLIQKGFWYRYVNEYKTDFILKSNGLLKDISTEGISIEIVDDSFKMLNFLIERCSNGKLMYLIPKRFYKKGRKER